MTFFFRFLKKISLEIFHMMSRVRMQNFMIIGFKGFRKYMGGQTHRFEDLLYR